MTVPSIGSRTRDRWRTTSEATGLSYPPASWRSTLPGWGRGPARSSWCFLSCTTLSPPSCTSAVSSRSLSASRSPSASSFSKTRSKTSWPSRLMSCSMSSNRSTTESTTGTSWTRISRRWTSVEHSSTIPCWFVDTACYLSSNLGTERSGRKRNWKFVDFSFLLKSILKVYVSSVRNVIS